MNFYNPYYFPYQNVTRGSLFGGLLKKISFSKILNGAERTLNTVNQIIPLVKQARPMVDNAKTMFRLMSEFNRDDSKKKNLKKESVEKTTINEASSNNGGPIFFQ